MAVENTPSILDQIVAATRQDLDKQRRLLPAADLMRLCEQHQRKIRDFARALRRSPDRRGGAPRVIAELKKASPSAGMIRADFKPLELARELEKAGAAALSVLTEPHFFQGAASTLSGVSKLVNIPVLRKDFIVDEYQIAQAYLWGADAVLLIARILDQSELIRLANAAHSFGLAVLGEAHSARELDRLLAVETIGCVGINCRNLADFSTDWESASALLDGIPADRVAVAESGIRNASDMAALNADAFLVGSLLMQNADPAAQLAQLLKP